MDIDEYLKKKKELEHKKESLESKNKEDKKKHESPKKEIEIQRKREITHINEPSHSRGHSRDYGHSRGGNDSLQWVFLGLAFFVALIILGIFFISKFMSVDTSASEKNSDVEELQLKLDELQKAINSSQKDVVYVNSSETNESEENNTVSTIGPEFKLYLVDEHVDSRSLGTFGASGKVAGNLIQIGTDNDIATYNYRVYVENLELTEIQCKLDKKTEFDNDQDGEIDNTDYHLDRYILEMTVGDEEILNDAVTGIGKITVEYEARCYFCENSDCDNVFFEGETVETAKLKVIIQTNDLNETI